MRTPITGEAHAGKWSSLRAAFLMFCLFFTLSVVWDDAAEALLSRPPTPRAKTYRTAAMFAVVFTALNHYQARRREDTPA